MKKSYGKSTRDQKHSFRSLITIFQYSYDRWNSGRDLTFTPRVLYDAVDLPAEAEYYADSEVLSGP